MTVVNTAAFTGTLSTRAVFTAREHGPSIWVECMDANNRDRTAGWLLVLGQVDNGRQRVRLGDDSRRRRRRRRRSGHRRRHGRAGVRVVDRYTHALGGRTEASAGAGVQPPGALDQPRDDVLTLALHRAAHRVVVLAFGALLQVAQIAAAFGARPEKVLGEAQDEICTEHSPHICKSGADDFDAKNSFEEVLGERVKYVDAVDAVVVANRDVEQHEPVVVRQRNSQRLFESVDELAKPFQRDVLRRLFVEQLPDLVTTDSAPAHGSQIS